MTSGRITSGSVESGAISRQAASGFLATGIRRMAGFAGSRGSGRPVANNGQMSYLPAPPQSLEVGPNSPQPAPDFLWSPRLLGLVREPIHLASRLLGPGATGVGLGAPELRPPRLADMSSSMGTGTTRSSAGG